MRAILTLTFVLLGFSSAAVYASVTDFPDAQASGPARLKWMVGAPPPPDRTVRFDDGSYFRFPAMRWSVANWSRLGSEQGAYFTVDSIGTPFAGGGLNAGLRDMARFGEMLRNGGRFNGQQVVPESVVKDIRQGSDKEAFAKAGYSQLKGWSYRAMWWVTHNPDGAYGPRRPRPEYLHRPRGRDGDCALCLPSGCGQCRERWCHLASLCGPGTLPARKAGHLST